MKWYEVYIKTVKDNIDDVSLSMISLGANGTVIKDPFEVSLFLKNLNTREYADEQKILEDNKECTVTGYYSIDEDINEVINRLFSLTGIKGDYSVVDDDDWKDKWKEYFKPFNITQRIRILPSWSEQAKEPTYYDIVMDPGMAFGTGTHETTKLCSMFLEKYIKPGDVMIDVGTGTGILSLVAVKNGLKKSYAIDIDTAAVKAAKENMVLNKAPDVEVIKGELNTLDKDIKADIIAANIVADVIIDLSGEFKNYLVEGGKVVCSGIINSRKDDVIKSLIDNGFEIIDQAVLNEWTAIVANA